MKRAAFVLCLSLAGCAPAPAPYKEDFYVANQATMDVRTAQDVVRRYLMTKASFVITPDTPNGKVSTVNDVQFRRDGLGVLVNNAGNQQMYACYYSMLEKATVNNVPRARFGSGGATFPAAYCPGSNGGAYAWFWTAEDARTFANAMYSLKASAR